MRFRLAPCCCLVLLACPPPTPGPDGGSAPAPTVTSVNPTSGPITGGTLVTVGGTNFASGARVEFGDVAGTQVVVAGATSLTVRSPALTQPLKVSVTVTNPDGKAGTLPDAFQFQAQSKVISEAVLLNAADTTDQSGTATVAVNVSASVQVPGVTPGPGQGAGVLAQVGFATAVSTPPANADFTWKDAAYAQDADGPTPGDLARDVYQADASLPGATTTALIYWVAARFSVDNGATWTIADRDGAANGTTAAQLARVVVVKPSVDWCKLGGETVQPPPDVQLRGTATGGLIFGQVYKPGVTTAAGAGAGIKGQLGVGAPGTDPSTWTWGDATFNRDTGGGSNDEFQATLPNPGPGAYVFAFRFNHQDGQWLYCDADGSSTGGFTEAQAGHLTVRALGVDSCRLQFPPTLDAREGRPAGTVYGQVFAQGITDGGTPSVGLEAGLGYGPTADLPSAASWVWDAGVFNVKTMTGGGEEYRCDLVGPAPGSYAYAYRFRYLSAPWTYCDLDGSDNGYSAVQAGQLVSKPFDVDECLLDVASATQTTTPSGLSAPMRVRVTVKTLTEAAGQGLGVTAEVGTGAVGAPPSTWTSWTPASYESDQAAADQYRAALTSPPATGTSEVAYRVRLGSNAWKYCDGDGLANGYSSAQAGRLTVAGPTIQSCTLQAVSAFSVPSGDPLTGTARVLVPGLSPQAGATPGLRVQLGVGPQGDNASASALWGWRDAAFSADVAATGEDEYALVFHPAYNGNRDVSARASLDNGATWTYCDLDGSGNGYQVAQQYFVAVTDHTDLAFCNLQFPASFGYDAGLVADVYGQLYEPGLTPNAAAPVTAEFGYGRKVEDPGLAWSWQVAPFSSASANNNEYRVQWRVDGGGWNYAFRYSRDGGSYCYGDLDGNGRNGIGRPWAGFSGDQGTTLNVGLVTP